MKSRIVYPAPSFQPPETCTEHEECLTGQATNAELCHNAQAHYDKVSTAAHEWHSAIPKAIDAYYADPERARLEREVIEATKQWLDESARIHSTTLPDAAKIELLLKNDTALVPKVRALREFESENGK